MKKLTKFALFCSALILSAISYADCPISSSYPYATTYCASNPYPMYITPGTPINLMEPNNPFTNPAGLGEADIYASDMTQSGPAEIPNLQLSSRSGSGSFSLLSGPLTTEGQYTINVPARNSNDPIGTPLQPTQNLPFVIQFTVLSLPVVGPFTAPDAVVGQPYEFNLGSNITGADTITINNISELGHGLSFGTNGVCQTNPGPCELTSSKVSGSPAANLTVSFTASNKAGKVPKSFPLTISAAPTTPPKITSQIPDQSGITYTPFTSLNIANVVENATSISFDEESWKTLSGAGFLFNGENSPTCSNGSNCILSGTPSKAFTATGGNALKFTATNGIKPDADGTFNMTVTNNAAYPIVTGSFNVTGTLGASLFPAYPLNPGSSADHNITNFNNITDPDNQLAKYGLGLVNTGSNTWVIAGTPILTTSEPVSLNLWAQNVQNGQPANQTQIKPATLSITGTTALQAKVTNFGITATAGQPLPNDPISFAPGHVQNVDFSVFPKSLTLTPPAGLTGLIVAPVKATNGVIVGATITGTPKYSPWIKNPPETLPITISAYGIGQPEPTPTTGTLTLSLSPLYSAPILNTTPATFQTGDGADKAVAQPGISNVYFSATGVAHQITDQGPDINGSPDTLANHNLELMQDSSTGLWSLTPINGGVIGATPSTGETFNLSAKNYYAGSPPGTGTLVVTITQGPAVPLIPKDIPAITGVAGAVIPYTNVARDFTPVPASSCALDPKGEGNIASAGLKFDAATCTFKPKEDGDKYLNLGQNFTANVYGLNSNGEQSKDPLKLTFQVNLGTYVGTDGQPILMNQGDVITATDIHNSQLPILSSNPLTASGLDQYNLALTEGADGLWHLTTLANGAANGGTGRNTTGSGSVTLTSTDSATTGTLQLTIAPAAVPTVPVPEQDICGGTVSNPPSSSPITDLTTLFKGGPAAGCEMTWGSLPDGLNLDEPNCTITGTIPSDWIGKNKFPADFRSEITPYVMNTKYGTKIPSANPLNIRIMVNTGPTTLTCPTKQINSENPGNMTTIDGFSQLHIFSVKQEGSGSSFALTSALLTPASVQGPKYMVCTYSPAMDADPNNNLVIQTTLPNPGVFSDGNSTCSGQSCVANFTESVPVTTTQGILCAQNTTEKK